MKSQANRELLQTAVRAMTERQVERMNREYDTGSSNYAYSAGYLESMVVSMLCDLPKAKREFYLKQIVGAK